MTNRTRLPNRRLNETFEIEVNNLFYYVTVGRASVGGPVMEVFLNSATKLSSLADINASDAAVAASLALQYGCPIETLREAMKRNPDGTAQGPLGAALDEVKT